jgi:uncharacterized protein YqgV (UPF0045/DUF77 family)
MVNATVGLQISPTMVNGKALQVVEAVIGYIKSTGVSYFVGPLETTIEGEFDILMEIIKQCQLIAMEEGALSINTHVKIIYNPESGVMTIDDKVSKYHK